MVEKITLQAPLVHCGRDAFRCRCLDLSEEQAARWNIDLGPLWEYTVREDGSAEITNWLGSGKKVVVPAEIDGHPVRSIASRPDETHGEVSIFYNRNSLQEIVLPEGLETIGAYAFARVSKEVKPIKIPSTVTAISPYAFYASGVSSLEIPNSVQTLGIACFASCTHLKTVRIGSGVTRIPADAFSNCFSLTSVTFGGTVEEFGDRAFEGTEKLTSFRWPAGLKRIGSRAFANCRQKNVVLPEGLEEIGEECFVVDDKYCDGISSLTVPGSLRVIPGRAFAYNKELKRVTISEGVEDIGTEAFLYCGLTALDLPASVKIVRQGAFAENTSLKKLTLKEGTEELQASCFLGHSLSKLVLPASLKSAGSCSLVPDTPKGSFSITVLGMDTELHEDAFCYLKNGYNWGKKKTGITCPEGSAADRMLQSGVIPEDRFSLSYLKK